MQNATAFILAGGRSTRMGRDKAFLELNGKTLLERSLETARGVAAQVSIVGPASVFAQHAHTIEDIYPDRGPLGGIHAALRSSETELNLALAVDLPFLSGELLGALLRLAASGPWLATVPRTPDGLQPLCAVYRRGFADLAEPALREGRCKIDALFTAENTHVVALGEPGFAFDAAMFQNLNTIQDMERARSQP